MEGAIWLCYGLSLWKLNLYLACFTWQDLLLKNFPESSLRFFYHIHLGVPIYASLEFVGFLLRKLLNRLCIFLLLFKFQERDLCSCNECLRWIALTCYNTEIQKIVFIRMKSMMVSQENPDKSNEIRFRHYYMKLLYSMDLDTSALKCP